MDNKPKNPRDFKVPSWMLEVSDDEPVKKTKPKAPVQRAKPQGQRKYKDKVESYLDRVDNASGYGKNGK